MNNKLRQFIGFLLLAVCCGGTGLRVSAAPPVPWMPHHRELVRDQVGNPWLRNHKIATRTADGRRKIGTRVPMSGNVNLLAIPVQFQADTDPTTSGTGIFPYKTWGPASGTNYLSDRLTKVAQYYSEVSNGNVTLVPKLAGVVTLPNPLRKYSTDLVSGDMSRAVSIMQDTVNAARSTVDFSTADIVMLIHAGAGYELNPSASNNDIQSLNISGVEIPVGTTAITGFSVVPETECNDGEFQLANPGLDIQTYEKNPNGKDPLTGNPLNYPHAWDVVGVMCHELGHEFGLPDVYDVNYNSGVNLNYWSLMAAGSYLPFPDPLAEGPPVPDTVLYGSVPCHMDAWCKQLLGWIPEINVVGKRTHERIPTQGYNGSSIYRMWTNGNPNSSEYFLLENRSGPGNTFEQYVPEHGLLIYHIDDTVGSLEANDLQINGQHPRIMPVPASGALAIDPNVGNFIPPVNTVWPSVLGKTHFGKLTTPNSKSYQGKSTAVDASNITVSGTDVYADLLTVEAFTFIDPQPGETIYVSKPTIRAYAQGMNKDTLVVKLNDVDYSNRLLTPYDPAVGDIVFQPAAPLTVGDYVVAMSAATGTATAAAINFDTSLNFSVKEKVLQSGLQMITLPAFNVGTGRQVFTGQTLLQLAWWNPAQGQYLKYPNTQAELTTGTWSVQSRDMSQVYPPAGLGYWINLPTSCVLRLEGDKLASNQQYALPLQLGFNLIGNPYAFPISFGSFLVEYAGAIYTMEQAVNAHLLDPILYGWDGNNYTMMIWPSGTLDPWVGYWIYARGGIGGSSTGKLRLIFQPMPAQSNGASLHIGRSQPIAGQWQLALRAADTTSTRYGAVTLGVCAAGQPITPMSILAPPPSPGGVMLTSLGGRGQEALLRDLRSVQDGATYCWALQVSAPAGAHVTMSWPDLTGLPKNYQLMLRDTVSGEERYLRTTPGYTVALGAQETTRNLVLTASPGALGTLQVQQLHAERSRANGSVTISCLLTQPASITAEIRTVTGRVIRRITSTAAVQGAVSLTWDGLDLKGRLVPRGAYQCHLYAEMPTGQSVNAMTLIPW